MFELTGRIGFSEGGADGRLHLHQLINYFQNTSTFHVTDTDLELPTPDTGFYMLAWQIEINELPKAGERVKIGTLVHELRGVYGSRNYWMDDENGKRFATAHMTGCFVDLPTQKLYKLSAEDMGKFPLEQKLDMDYLPRKIKMPETDSDYAPVLVTQRHLDMYGHVNNAEYAAIAVNYVPEALEWSRVQIEYKKAAVLGQLLYPTSIFVDGSFYLMLGDEKKNPYALFVFS